MGDRRKGRRRKGKGKGRGGRERGRREKDREKDRGRNNKDKKSKKSNKKNKENNKRDRDSRSRNKKNKRSLSPPPPPKNPFLKQENRKENNNNGGDGGGGGCPKPENELWPHEGVGQVTLDIRKGVTIILPSEKLIDKRLHQIQLSTGIVPNVSFRQYIDERGEKSWRWLEMEIDQPHVGHRREKDDAKRARERMVMRERQ